jgi:hypothetical protein
VSWPSERCGRAVVVPQVLGQRPVQVLLVDDQQPAEEFPAQGTDDPFADRVRPGRLRRAAENPDALRGEHGSERAGELTRPAPDQELDPGRALPETHQQVTDLRPGAGRPGGAGPGHGYGARPGRILGRRWHLISRRVGQLLPESLLVR